MKLPVAFQLRQFLLAVAFGAALAVFWCFLRALRSLFPRLTPCCDAVFSLLLTPSLLLFALYAGKGKFPVFFVPSILSGFFLLKKVFGTALQALFRLLLLPMHTAATFFRKMRKKSFLLQKNGV